MVRISRGVAGMALGGRVGCWRRAGGAAELCAPAARPWHLRVGEVLDLDWLQAAVGEGVEFCPCQRPRRSVDRLPGLAGPGNGDQRSAWGDELAESGDGIAPG